MKTFYLLIAAVGTGIINKVPVPEKYIPILNLFFISVRTLYSNWNCFRLALVVVIHRKDPIDIAEDIRESTGL